MVPILPNSRYGRQEKFITDEQADILKKSGFNIPHLMPCSEWRYVKDVVLRTRGFKISFIRKTMFSSILEKPIPVFYYEIYYLQQVIYISKKRHITEREAFDDAFLFLKKYFKENTPSIELYLKTLKVRNRILTNLFVRFLKKYNLYESFAERIAKYGRYDQGVYWTCGVLKNPFMHSMLFYGNKENHNHQAWEYYRHLWLKEATALHMHQLTFPLLF